MQDLFDAFNRLPRRRPKPVEGPMSPPPQSLHTVRYTLGDMDRVRTEVQEAFGPGSRVTVTYSDVKDMFWITVYYPEDNGKRNGGARSYPSVLLNAAIWKEDREEILDRLAEIRMNPTSVGSARSVQTRGYRDGG